MTARCGKNEQRNQCLYPVQGALAQAGKQVSTLQAGKGQYIHVDNTSDAERALNDDIAKLQKGDVTSVVYSAYDEQFQAVGILIILLLIIEVCLLESKESSAQKHQVF